jgi:hypothetical protein
MRLEAYKNWLQKGEIVYERSAKQENAAAPGREKIQLGQAPYAAFLALSFPFARRRVFDHLQIYTNGRRDDRL